MPAVIVTLVTAALLALLEWREMIRVQLQCLVAVTVLRSLASELTRPIPTSSVPVVFSPTFPLRCDPPAMNRLLFMSRIPPLTVCARPA